jgi:hypothetical protein
MVELNTDGWRVRSAAETVMSAWGMRHEWYGPIGTVNE